MGAPLKEGMTLEMPAGGHLKNEGQSGAPHRKSLLVSGVECISI